MLDLSATCGYIYVFQGTSGSFRAVRQHLPHEAKPRKSSIFGVGSRIYSEE